MRIPFLPGLPGVLLAAGVSAFAPAPVAAQAADARAQSTEERLEELALQVKILQRQIEIDKEQAAERATTTPRAGAGRGGFSIQSPGGDFRLRLRGMLQADSRFFLNDADQRGVDSFLLRRVRPIVESTIFGQFDFRIMPDFGGGATVLQDAYVDARFRPQFRIRAGKFKAPFGMERLVSATELTFIERALPTSLVPNRDVGVMAHGDLRGDTLSYAVGLFNGVVDGGSADLDIQDGKDLVARLFAQPFRSRRDGVWQGLGAGVAVSYGVHRGAAAGSTALPVLRTSGQQPFFAFRGDDPVLGPVIADGGHARMSLQGHYYHGPLGVLGEHVLSSQRVRRQSVAATLRNSSWQVAGSWVLTGETASYRGVTPRTPFDVGTGGWGALELTARYTALDIDRDAFPIFANAAAAASGARAWTAGANWILNTGVRLQVNYERTDFDTAGSVRRRAEHDLLTRVQFSF